ncbi:hypothetical protein GCM10023235_75540 [Kitasatospora terrestris]|uniref:Uncharacterized protein n=1 Tax=Kitasatospora terrestris TaxID=258051 RepID=A0ABP9ENQ1_9ACTN
MPFTALSLISRFLFLPHPPVRSAVVKRPTNRPFAAGPVRHAARVVLRDTRAAS